MKKRFTDEQIIGFLKQADAGVSVKELCRKHGFSGMALDQWAYQNGVQLKLIEPGKPTQNAYIESFNAASRQCSRIWDVSGINTGFAAPRPASAISTPEQ